MLGSLLVLLLVFGLIFLMSKSLRPEDKKKNRKRRSRRSRVLAYRRAYKWNMSRPVKEEH